ncbi:MAG: chemotaxis-specific protein-glutamate methyltransferase CheB [Herpetosiphon sp.]
MNMTRSPLKPAMLGRTAQPKQTIRVLVVDDSALMRRAIADVLACDPEIEIVGMAENGRVAIRQVAVLRPDVITMDVRMPIMDGVATTEYIMAYFPTPILVLTASVTSFDVDISFRMLGVGALDLLEKPSSSHPGGFNATSDELIRRVKLLSRVRAVRHLRGRRQSLLDGMDLSAGALASLPVSPAAGPSGSLVVIGASTGGPQIIQQILSKLPASFPGAVLVVQHIAEGFTSGLVEWLGATCALPLRIAEPGMVAEPGTVTVAPDKRHLLMDEHGHLLVATEPLLIQCPSIDITMQRAAHTYGHAAVGVLLTGMGRDGAAGMQAIKAAGGWTIAQSGATCAIFGMPKAAIDLGGASEVLDPEAIAPRLGELMAAVRS